MRIIDEPQLRDEISLNKPIVDIIEQAFVSASSPEAQLPAMQQLLFGDNQQVCIKSAYSADISGVVTKLSIASAKDEFGEPKAAGLMLVVDPETGQIRTLLQDNGYLTAIRTAAAGAVSARHLAPEQVNAAGVIGSGRQALLQVEAVMLERKIPEIRIWHPVSDRLPKVARLMEQRFSLPVIIEKDAKSLGQNSNLIITATSSERPLLHLGDVSPGTHVTAMGSDRAGKQELCGELVEKADLYVCDIAAQAKKYGELRTAIEEGRFAQDFQPVELGNVVRGSAPKRNKENEITICDLTGMGLQDQAIAVYAESVCLEG